MADKDLATVLTSVLGDLPQVSVEKKANHLSFLVGEKIFAYTHGDGVVMKLPEGTTKGLVDRKYAAPLVMGKKTMKEWLVIEHKDPEAYKQDLKLFKEAIGFVSSQA